MQEMSNTEKLKRIWEVCPWLRGVDIYTYPEMLPNGCGPDTMKSERLHILLNHPAGLPALDIWGDVHDALFAIGGTEDDFDFANRQLARLLRYHTNEVHWYNPMSWLRQWRLDARAAAYYASISIAGRRWFTWRTQRVGVARFTNPLVDIDKAMLIPKVMI